jgi:hypothetical protein
MPEPEPKKRGPKGGIKHQPGRGHDKKSRPIKVNRFKKRAARRRQELVEEARRQWALYDRLTKDQRHLMDLPEPTLPRPEEHE